MTAPSLDVVYKPLSKLNERKSAGLDNTPNKLLRMAASIVSPSLTAIFAKSIETCIFPDKCKLVRVTPIFNQYLSYRPLPKYLKNVSGIKLVSILALTTFLSHCQSAFRSLHSTLTALVDAANSWSVNIDNGLVNGVVFIDLKKAFDAIDHNILLRKLRLHGVDTISIKGFESYLLHRCQRCSLAGQLSNPAPFSCGIPQGSNLGPLLFLVYINDLPNCLRLTSPRMFAEDTNITFAASTLIDLEKGLNTEFRSLNQWLISNKLLSLNVAKTEYMVIGSNQGLHSFSDEQINTEIDAKLITKVKEAKSLGVIIDEHLSWSNHIDALSKKISSARTGALKRIRPLTSEHTALQIYQAFILPHFDYCSSVWGDCNIVALFGATAT